ncbi:MAG: hypothetical protein IJ678_06045 [Kiritimatiellae bacterium]|nr:hypothetical protein [Kiritimatiellia bacterium]
MSDSIDMFGIMAALHFLAAALHLRLLPRLLFRLAFHQLFLPAFGVLHPGLRVLHPSGAHAVSRRAGHGAERGRDEKRNGDGEGARRNAKASGSTSIRRA